MFMSRIIQTGNYLNKKFSLIASEKFSHPKNTLYNFDIVKISGQKNISFLNQYFHFRESFIFFINNTREFH